MNRVKAEEAELTTPGLTAKMVGMNDLPTRPFPRAAKVDAIGQRLKATRLALGFNQTQLCKAIGVATNTYNQWEMGRNRPQLDYIIIYCEAFDLTLDWIYRGEKRGLPFELATKILSFMPEE